MKKGFTLIELLVVVAIIGILATIIIIALGGAKAGARDARRASDLKETQNALEIYFSRNNEYPASVGGSCGISWCGVGATCDPTSLTGVLLGAGLGFSNIPQDPQPASKSYCYCTNATNQSYALAAQLEDTASKLLQSSITTPPCTLPAGVTCGTAGWYCVSI